MKFPKIIEQKNHTTGKESALSEEGRLLELLESAGSCFLRVDDCGKIEYLSPAFSDVIGKSVQHFEGKPFLDFFSQGDSLPEQILQDLKLGGSSAKLSRSFNNSNTGQTTLVDFNFSPRKNGEGKWNGFDAILLISALSIELGEKQAGLELKLEEAIKIKDRFLSNISHEIRTPLNGILGMVQLLNNTELDFDQREFINIISKSGENLLQTLNQLIDLSLALEGDLKMRENEINVAKLFSFTSSLYAEQALLKNIDLDFQIKEDNINIVSDEFRIQQILKQLISNALTFTEKGSILVTARLENHASRNFLMLEVSDTGMGIEAERQPFIDSILSKDATESNTAFSQAKGGLGLLTVRMISDALRAEPGFVSAPGKGSTFWVKIPVMLTSPKISEPIEDDRSNTAILKRISPRVLLTDDNAVNLKVASEILSRAGCRVVVATNGKEAVEKASKEFFHIILMDIQMPVMDGLEASRKIQELSLENPPAIIAMTAYVMNEDKKRFLEAGMDDFIPKPISGDKILSKVRHWTEKSILKNPLSKSQHRKLEHSENLLSRVFDFEVLRNLKKHLGEETLLASIEEFAIELRDLLSEVESTISKNQIEDLQRCFHTMKGNAGTFGVYTLALISKDLENDVKTANIAAVLEKTEQLQQAAFAFLDSYKLLYTNYEWKN